MKKFLSVALVIAMMFTMSMASFAVEPTTLPELFADLGISSTRSLDVPVDMQVDLGQTGVFEDAPDSIVASSAVADYKATIYMSGVRALYNAYMTTAQAVTSGVGTLQSQLDNCKITGSFVIKIKYPDSVIVPDSVINGTNLAGFNASASNIFEETAPRTVSTSGGETTLTITLDVVGPAPARNGYVLASDMTLNLASYLPDISFECVNVEIAETGSHKVVGEITGQTLIHDEYGSLVGTINYVGKQGTNDGVTGTEISETVVLSSGGNAGIPIIPSRPSTPDVPEGPVEVEIALPHTDNPAPIVIPEGTKNPTINIEEIIEEVKPEREGFHFDGFYADELYTEKLTGEVPVTEDLKLHARFINTTVPEIFDDSTHIQYVYGFTDGTMRPTANVTREEIASMFYRLLKDDVRESLTTEENPFSDVEDDRWSKPALSAMAKGGYLYGYTDGSFNPTGDITRAEFAAIASRFVGSLVEGKKSFSDIDGHWAEDAILSIANNEWIYGYVDGGFRPDAKITRAEAIAIINRIVVRYVSHDGLEDVSEWSDVDTEAWYYLAVIEATHGHDYERKENHYTENWNAAESN